MNHSFQIGDEYKLVLQKFDDRVNGISGYIHENEYFSGSLETVFKWTFQIMFAKGRISFEQRGKIFGYTPEEVQTLIEEEQKLGSKIIIRNGKHFLSPIRLIK
jgi:hypothetical protein